MNNTNSLQNVARVIPKAKGKRGFSQGFFIPSHPEKYTGNVNEIRYLSSWEVKLMRFLDSNPAVLNWLSESYPIDYWSEADNKMRKYYIDFFVKILKDDGTQENLAIEVKPHSEKYPPKKSKRKREDVYLKEEYTYRVNQAKWKTAEEWCKHHNFRFVVMDEYDLGIKKKK